MLVLTIIEEPKCENEEYGVKFPLVPGCFSSGCTLEEAKKNAVEALTLHFEGMIEGGEFLSEIPVYNDSMYYVHDGFVMWIEYNGPIPKREPIHINIDDGEASEAVKLHAVKIREVFGVPSSLLGCERPDYTTVRFTVKTNSTQEKNIDEEAIRNH